MKTNTDMNSKVTATYHDCYGTNPAITTFTYGVPPVIPTD